MTKETKINRKDVIGVLGIKDEVAEDSSILSFSKGMFTLRHGYFYRHERKPDTDFERQEKLLSDAGLEVFDAEYGDHFAAFRGDEGVCRNSHFWFRFKLRRKESP